MLRITQEAQRFIIDYLKDREPLPPIRIFPAKKKCSGPPLQLSLDQQKETDLVFDVDRLRFVVDEVLIQRVEEIRIEVVDTGGQMGLAVIPLTQLNPIPSCGNPCGHACPS